METTFNIGDRVRLKAWITKTKLGGLDNLFPQGCVGIVTGDKGLGWRIPYLSLKVQTLQRSYHRVCAAVEDLELMPERQVHIVKDGKVYELRNTDSKRNCYDCQDCAFRRMNCKALDPGSSCENGWKNFQEVTSGKLVS